MLNLCYVTCSLPGCAHGCVFRYLEGVAALKSEAFEVWRRRWAALSVTCSYLDVKPSCFYVNNFYDKHAFSILDLRHMTWLSSKWTQFRSGPYLGHGQVCRKVGALKEDNPPWFSGRGKLETANEMAVKILDRCTGVSEWGKDLQGIKVLCWHSFAPCCVCCHS